MAAGDMVPGGLGDLARNLRKDPAWTGIQAGLPQPQKGVPDDQRIGAPGTTIRFGRIQYEEFNLDLENEAGRGDGLGTQGVFDKMRKTDPDIRRMLQLLKSPIIATVPKMEPVDDSPIEKEIAELVAYNLFELNPWQQTIREIGLMYDFGFSTFECLFGRIKVPRTRFPNIPQGAEHPKGVGEPLGPGRPAQDEMVEAIGLTALDLRHPKTIYQWAPDPDRPTRLKFVVQRLTTSDTELAVYRPIPAERLLRFTHDQEGGNFAGVSALRAAFKPWKIKELLEEIDTIRHERQNVGIAVLEQPQQVNTKELDKLESILAKIGSFQGSFLSHPFGYKFRFETSGQGEGTKVEAAIQRCIRAIADSICAGFMTLGNGDTGSYAMADVQKSGAYEEALEAGAYYIETGFNHGYDGWSPIKRIVDMNYGPRAEYPRLRLTNLRNAVLMALPKLALAGLLTTDRKLRNVIRADANLPPEGEVDMREADDPRDEEAAIQEEYEQAPEEGPPGKTPMTPVPGDKTSKAVPGTPLQARPNGNGQAAPGSPVAGGPKPAARPAGSAARQKLARQLMQAASSLLEADGGAP